MFYHNRIDFSVGIDVAKSINTKECIIYHYCYFNHGFKFQNSVYNDCQDLTMLCLNPSHFASITVRGAGYLYIIHDTIKSDAICLLKNSLLDDCGYIENAYQRNQY